MKTTVKMPQGIETAAREWVARRDAGLSASEAADLALWRSDDPRHEEAFSRYEAAWSALGRPRRTGAAIALTREIAAVSHRQKKRRMGAAAAVLTLLLVIGGVWQVQRMRPGPFLPSTVVMMVPQHQVLPDGSVVESPIGSELIVDFSGKLRRVALRKGEAHFKVAKNPERPFVVEAGGIEFRAVGTAFAVQLGAKVELLVTEGRVAVDRPSADLAKPELVETLAYVDAGNRLAFDPAGTIAPVPAAVATTEMDERLAWRNPRVEFSGTPLHEVVGIINRYNRVRFVIGDEALGEVPLSGLFRADDPDTFARLLESGFGVTSERHGDEVILRKTH